MTNVLKFCCATAAMLLVTYFAVLFGDRWIATWNEMITPGREVINDISFQGIGLALTIMCAIAALVIGVSLLMELLPNGKVPTMQWYLGVRIAFLIFTAEVYGAIAAPVKVYGLNPLHWMGDPWAPVLAVAFLPLALALLGLRMIRSASS